MSLYCVSHRVSTPSFKLDIPVKHLQTRGQEPCGVCLQASLIQNMKEVSIIAEHPSWVNEGEFVHLHHSGEDVVEEGLTLCDDKAPHPSEVGAAIRYQKYAERQRIGNSRPHYLGAQVQTCAQLS